MMRRALIVICLALLAAAPAAVAQTLPSGAKTTPILITA